MAKEPARKRTSNYHSPLRAKQAAQTRRAVIDAALLLFSENGWAATTVPMFGTKASLLMTVVDVAIVGDDDETAMADRPDFALLGQGRRHERLRTGVRYTMAVYARSVPILRTLMEASASDEVARARHVQYDLDRRALIAAGMELILQTPPSVEIVDAVAALVSPEVYTYLLDQGWSEQAVEDWFVDLVKVTVDRA